MSSLTVGSVTLSPEPVLQVLVGPQTGGVTLKVTAVADTGPQVCVARPTLKVLLGLKPAQLKRRAGIRALAKIPLTSLGTALCRIIISGRSTIQEVCFIESVEHMYLSFTTCKELSLVHADYP